MTVYRSKNEIPTIDVSLVTIATGTPNESDYREFGFDTSNQIQVEPLTEEQEAVKLVVKGILRAQKPKKVTITGNQITLTDNVFNPELVLTLQGGTITYDTVDTTKVKSYKPPVIGDEDAGETFTLNAYSAIYNAAGQITGYEKIAYPNCKGQPVAFNTEDGTFRAPEYKIDSAPDTGEAPYEITYVAALPTLVSPSA